MTDKKTETIHLKVSKKLHMLLSELSDKNDRTIQREAIHRIKLGIHQDNFDSKDFE